jgi:formyl-CoA transferase
LRVVDLTRVLGGPYATMVLSDHGADVIKVEPPQGDEVRDWGPPFLEQPDGTRDASYFLGVNRNKRSIALDIATPDGRAVLRRLLRDADVLVENFKPGAMEKWGLGYADLEPTFPRLIHCRVSGFGADGPLGGLPGYDAILQAMVGLMSVNGEVASGPLRIGTPVVDMVTGLYSVIAILMAAHERTRSGRGQFLDMTLHDCGMALLHPHAANFFLGGKRPMPLGNPHPNIAPYSKFATATGDIFLCIGNDAQFRRLCAELDRPALARDPRFASNADRVAHRAALTEALEEALAAHDGAALAERLLRAGLPAGPVLPIDRATAAPHTAAREMVVDRDGVRTLGTPIKLSRTPGGPVTGPPRFAQHTGEVLADLGYDEAEITRLRREGVAPATRRT